MSSIPTKIMATDARYSPFDHGGLEVAYNQNSGLEVVKDDAAAPEVVAGSPLNKSSSRDQPEIFSPGQYSQHDGAYNHVGSAPPYTENGTAYGANSGKEGAMATPYNLEAGKESPAQSGKDANTIWGMPKKRFVTVLIVVLVVILAAVLGGVLGGVLGHHNSSHSDDSSNNPGNSGGSQNNSSTSPSTATPLQSLSNTGFASMIDGDGSGRLVTYYQDAAGRIIENSLLDGQWTLDDHSLLNSSVVTTSSQLGTPMAAVTYNLGGQTYRQLFFLSSQGYVQTVNSSTTTSSGISTNWTTPYTIARDKAVAGSVAMAACADNTAGGMTGVRMYYGSQNGTIQEVGYNFTAPQKGWTEWMQFWQSDPNSGVDCTLWNDGADRWISVYFRNGTTSTVEQQVWNYRYQNGWGSGPFTTVNIAAGSDVAACTDGQLTDYVFYQIPGGTVTRAMVQPAGTSQFLSYSNQQTATVGTRLSAAYFNGGSLYMFQNSSSTSTMWAQDVSRSGAIISDMVIS